LHINAQFDLRRTGSRTTSWPRLDFCCFGHVSKMSRADLEAQNGEYLLT
jgi:hypothetical protein